MRPFTFVFGLWILLSPVAWASAAEDFSARGKELLANKEKLGETDRLHRLFAFGNPPHDIVVEVDRYIVWPSQALGYKIGQSKIRQLRTDAEKALGANFDLRVFHDEVLKKGALPMSVLETHLKGWVAKRKDA